MAAEKGSAMVIKIGDGASSEQFTTIGGMRTKSIKIDNQLVDISDDDSGQFRELMEGIGEKTVTVSGSGVFKDDAAIETLRAASMSADEIDNYEIVFASGDKFSGAFLIASIEFGGEHRGPRTFSLTLESAGTITYTPSA